jgi:hypothetical protein
VIIIHPAGSKRHAGFKPSPADSFRHRSAPATASW